VIWRDQNGQLQPPGLRPLIDAGVERLAEQGVVMDVSQARPQTITHACRWILGIQFGTPVEQADGDAGQMQAGQRPRRQHHAPTPREDDGPQCHYMTWGKRCELNAVEGQDYCVEHTTRPRKTHALYSAGGTSEPCQDWMDGNSSNAAHDETDSGDHEDTQETTATDQSDYGPAQKKGKRW